MHPFNAIDLTVTLVHTFLFGSICSGTGYRVLHGGSSSYPQNDPFWFGNATDVVQVVWQFPDPPEPVTCAPLA